MADELGRLFLRFSIDKLEQLTSRIEDCLSRLSDEQIWLRGSDNENAAGNLVLHLCGNIRQWLLSGVGGAPDLRERDREFTARGGASREALLESLRKSVREAVALLGTLSAEQLGRTVVVQGFARTALEAVYHVVEHFSMHTGQILYLTKMLTGADLGYYSYLSRAAHHSEQIP